MSRTQHFFNAVQSRATSDTDNVTTQKYVRRSIAQEARLSVARMRESKNLDVHVKRLETRVASERGFIGNDQELKMFISKS